MKEILRAKEIPKEVVNEEIKDMEFEKFIEYLEEATFSDEGYAITPIISLRAHNKLLVFNHEPSPKISICLTKPIKSKLHENDTNMERLMYEIKKIITEHVEVDYEVMAGSRILFNGIYVIGDSVSPVITLLLSEESLNFISPKKEDLSLDIKEIDELREEVKYTSLNEYSQKYVNRVTNY